MSLTIRSRLYILALVPLLVIALGMLGFTYIKTNELNAQQIEVTRSNMMYMKKEELKNYLQVAQSAVQPLLDKGARFEEATPILKALRYGKTGYFFGYNSTGIKRFVGDNTDGIGQNYWDLQDKKGNYLVRDLIRNSKTGTSLPITFLNPAKQ